MGLQEEIGRESAKILVVDDEPANNILLQDTLEPLGYTVSTATSGFAAIREVAANPPDVILLDIMMPGLDGFEVCRRLKADPAAAPIPILFLTALTDLETKIHAFESGGADFVTKPFQEAEVRARVRAQLRIRFQQLELKEYAERLEEMVASRTQLLIHADRLVTLGTMSAKIIHEINNPLTTVLGQMQMLSASWNGVKAEIGAAIAGDSTGKLPRLTEAIDESASEAFDAAKRIALIADGLRQYGRRGGGRVRAEKPLVEIVRHAARLLQPRIRVNVKVIVDIPENLSVHCDAQLMEQVFINLIANSADAMNGRGEVRIVARDDGGRIAIDYSDTGPGIPAEFADKVFEPFFTTKDESAGTGLGLMIISEILRAHDGTIRLVQDDRPGAKFQLSLNPRGAAAVS